MDITPKPCTPGAPSPDRGRVERGAPLKNGKPGPLYYIDEIFGDWVKWQRREKLGLTQAQAAANLSRATGRDVIGTDWNNFYENMGRVTTHSHVTKSGRKAHRRNPITVSKCRDVALGLEIPLQEVVAEARRHTEWEGDPSEMDVEWNTMGYILSAYPQAYADVIAYAREAHRRAKSSPDGPAAM